MVGTSQRGRDGFNEPNVCSEPLKRKGPFSRGGEAAPDGLGKRREGGLSRSGSCCLGNGDFRHRKKRSGGSWVICSRADLMRGKARRKGKRK